MRTQCSGKVQKTELLGIKILKKGLGVSKEIGWIAKGKANKISGRISWRGEKKMQIIGIVERNREV